jgi:hypothetical protein
MALKRRLKMEAKNIEKVNERFNFEMESMGENFS